MRYGSVCSGIEAASIAWEPLGWAPDWFSEVDAFPSAVLAHHWPRVPNLGDMTQLPELVRSGITSAPDILVGGTPCQSFSVAGLRKGFTDERGQLTMKYVELLDAIDETRAENGDWPAIAVWENVPGVLSDRSNAFGCFLAGLAGEDRELQPPGRRWTNAGCVYGPKRAIAWRVLDAQYFGVAQRRRRVFVVASARADTDPGAILFERESPRRDTAPRRETGQEAAARAGGRTKTASHWSGGPQPSLSQSHNTGGIGVSNQELFSQQGAGLVKGFRMAAFGEYADDETASTMKARDYKDATDLAVTASIQNATRGKSQNGLGVASAKEPMYTLDQASQHGVATTVVHGTQDPCVSDSTAFALGRNNGGENAVYAFQERGRANGRELEIGGDVAYALTAPNGGGRSQERNILDGASRAVRRLTPVECERLQGFPEHEKTFSARVFNRGLSECSENQVSLAPAVAQNHRSQKPVLNAEGGELQSPARHVEQSSITCRAEKSELAAVNALIDLERQHLLVSSAEKLIWSASIAGPESASLLPIQGEDFARLAALMTQTAAPATHSGKVASQGSETSSSNLLSGRQRSELCGREIEGLASDAEGFTKTVRGYLRSTTSQAGRISQTHEQPSTTLFCYVAAAINGFIPERTRSADSYSLKVTISYGHTAVPYRNKLATDCPDGPRYKAIGNSMAVPCMAWIGARIQKTIRSHAPSEALDDLI